MPNTPPNTVGILYPGDMGSAMAKLLAEGGSTVCTVIEGRSPRTQRLCHAADMKVLPSLQELLDRCDIVISLVPPSAALPVAREVAGLTRNSDHKPLYVDANSISPSTMAEIAQVLRSSNLELVDAAIQGMASRLREQAILYLSGARASEVAGRIGPLMRVQIVGPTPGQASAMKMVLAGLAKGLAGLFIESMVLACELRLLDEALEGCEHFYPGVMEAVRRMLPTYPRHAGRRYHELVEIEETMQANHLTPRVIGGVRDLMAELAGLEWTKGSEDQYSVLEIIDEVHKNAVRQHSQKQANCGLADDLGQTTLQANTAT